MLSESVDVVIDDTEWIVASRDKNDRSRNCFNAMRDRRASSQQRFARDRGKSGSSRSQAALSNGVHRRSNKRSLYAS